MLVRLLGLLLLVGTPVLLLPLMMKFPGRSVNTGMADSGCFGWVAAAIMVLGLILLTGGKKAFEKDKEDDEEKPKD